jgi:acyl dehydratase
MSSLHIRDAASLNEHLKREVGVSDYVEIDQELIKRFADTTQDHQWIHVDPDRAARESPFGGTVAHGFLTLSFLSHFLASTVQVDTARLVVSCGLSTVRFMAPVPAASRIRARVRLRELQPDDTFMQATWRFTIEREGSRTPCCVADWIVRYFA